MAKPHSRVGVIFKFNSSGVFFQFAGAESEVGFVKPTDIKINSKETIPPSANTTALLSKYIQAGDELKCSVTRKEDLDKFSYVQEEEEFDTDGNIKQKLKTNEIQPHWLATSAELIVPSTGKKGENIEVFDCDEGLSEDQLDDDDVILIEDVDISDVDESPKKLSQSHTEKQECSTAEEKVNGTSLKVDNHKSPSFKKSVKPLMTAIEKSQIAKAKLVQLVKPGQDCVKVVSAVFQILTGHLSGTLVTVLNNRMYAWGHHLGLANLMINLQYGEECTIEYQIDVAANGKSGASNLKSSLKTVTSLWFGSKTAPSARPGGDPLFYAWLSQRNIDEKYFFKWIRNQVPPKPFLPLISDQYNGKVIGYIREDNFTAVGVFLKLGGLVRKASENNLSSKVVPLEQNPTKRQDELIDASELEKAPEGESDLVKKLNKINKWSEKQKEDGEIAILNREDFYVCGVGVGCADLRLLLKINDAVICQIRPVHQNDKKPMGNNFAQLQNRSVTQVVFMGFVGPHCPKESNLAPTSSPHLAKFLRNRGLSMPEFVSMRNPPLENTEPSQHDGTQQLPLNLGGAPGPFLGNRSAPPGHLFGASGHFIPQVPMVQINIATNLAARAINIPSPYSMGVRSLLQNPAEFAIATKVAKVLTQALIHTAQGKDKSKTISDLNSQQKELESLNKNVKHQKLAQKSSSLPPEQNIPLKPAPAKELRAVEENQVRPTKRPGGQLLHSERASKVSHFEKSLLNSNSQTTNDTNKKPFQDNFCLLAQAQDIFEHQKILEQHMTEQEMTSRSSTFERLHEKATFTSSNPPADHNSANANFQFQSESQQQQQLQNESQQQQQQQQQQTVTWPENEKQRQKEEQQQKLWDQFIKEKEEKQKKLKEEETLTAKLRVEEVLRQRVSEEKLEKIKLQQAELEKARLQKEQEMEHMRIELIKQEEFERKRMLEEQDIKEMLNEQESKRLREKCERLLQFKDEQKRREEEKSKKEEQMREIEQERLWKIEMEKRLRMQQQNDELERRGEEQRLRNFIGSRPPPIAEQWGRGPPLELHSLSALAFDFKNSANPALVLMVPPTPDLNIRSTGYNSPPPPPQVSSAWVHGSQNNLRDQHASSSHSSYSDSGTKERASQPNVFENKSIWLSQPHSNNWPN